MAETSRSTASAEETIHVQDILQGDTLQYQILKRISSGSFGVVFKGQLVDSNELVAIKVYKDDEYLHQGLREFNILNMLRPHAETYNFLLVHQKFYHHGHLCFVSEALDIDLYSFMRNNGPLCLTEIKPILKQLLLALMKLRDLNIVHADIKPENVLFVNCIQVPQRIKLIDFSLSLYASEEITSGMHKACIQTLYYRAPEVILQMQFDEAVDMWSFGCLAAELFLGFTLFRGRNEQDIIEGISHTICEPSSDMLDYCHRWNMYFKWNKYQGTYKLRENWLTQRSKFEDLDVIIMNCSTGDCSVEDKELFLQFLYGLLMVDPGHRLTPFEALEHDFLKGRRSRSQEKRKKKKGHCS